MRIYGMDVDIEININININTNTHANMRYLSLGLAHLMVWAFAANQIWWVPWCSKLSFRGVSLIPALYLPMPRMVCNQNQPWLANIIDLINHLYPPFAHHKPHPGVDFLVSFSLGDDDPQVKPNTCCHGACATDKTSLGSKPGATRREVDVE